MSAAVLLALALAAGSPEAPPAGPGPAPDQAPPAPFSLGAAAPAPAALALPAAALALLAVAALLASRRRRATPRLLQVLETTALGPRRSLVVARLGDELLVLGASEAGLHLLASRPAIPPAPAAGEEEVPRLHPVPDPAPALPGRLAGWMGRLRRAPGPNRAGAPSPEPAFDALLAESAEDLELRRKLARGLSGSVR